MADIEIGYKGSTITSINSGGVTTLNTIGTFCEDNITVTFNKTQGEAFTPATTITTNPSITLSATTGTITAFYSGASNITPTVTPGYVSAGTAGTVRTSGTSTYQLSTVAAQTITPTTASQLAVASGRFTTGSVYVGAIPSTYVQPTGTLTISANGTYDVTEYASVSTNISEGERFAPIYKNLAFRSTLYASGSSTTSYGSYTASDISDWCDSLSKISEGQFANQLFSGSFIFNNVKYINTYGFGSAFTNVYIGGIGCDFVFPSCLSIGGGAFVYNQNITNIDAKLCQIIGDYAFSSCTRLKSVSLSSCTSVGSYAFFRCKELTSINLPVCTYISSSAFCSCSKLTEINLPSCTSIEQYAFAYCSNLKSVNLPVCTSIGWSAFQNCLSLTNVYCPSCISIGNYAFRSCPWLQSVDANMCSYIGSYAFAYNDRLKDINIQSCISINSYAFVSCLTLSSINIPLCEYIGAYAFSSCGNLENINMPLCSYIGALAFDGCTELKSANIPLCSQINQSTFLMCNNMTTVILQSCTIIQSQAFNYCYNLLSLYLLGSSIVSLGNINAFNSTPISTYTTSTGGVYGSIFVRVSLYNSYLTATNWSRFSSRFVSLTDAQIEALEF